MKPRSDKGLTATRLRQVLSYDPDTGTFVWAVDKSQAIRAGDVAGHVHKPSGYRTITIDGRAHYANRLAWLHAHGEFPAGEVDHIDRDRDNSSLRNLRIATRSENCSNRVYEDARSGFRGVFPHGRKWRARISINRKQQHIGLFPTAKDAAVAYDAKALATFGPFAVLNFQSGGA